MRARGTGSVTPHQGQWWARYWDEGKRKSAGLWPTQGEAELALDTVLALRSQTVGASTKHLTFRSFGERVLDRREAEGVESIASERSRFKKHLAECRIAGKAVADVSSLDVRDLRRALAAKKADDKREPRKLDRKTVDRCMALVRAIFAEAGPFGDNMRPDDPCLGMKSKKRGNKDEYRDEDGDEIWDYLRLEEQHQFLSCDQVPGWLKALVRSAWGTGMRQGEMWRLKLTDLHLDDAVPWLFVRKAKNGRPRKVRLFGEGLSGVTAWMALLPTYCPKNPFGLVFPTPSGCKRQSGGPQCNGPRTEDGRQTKIYLLAEALTKAGVTRHMRWHDLRHTCGSALISGMWGRKRTLIEVRDHLGHSSVKITERYAHLDPEAIANADAIADDGVIREAIGNGPGGSGVAAISNDLNEVGRTGLEPVTYGLKGPTQTEQLREVRSDRNPSIAPSPYERLQALMAEGRASEAMALAATISLASIRTPKWKTSGSR